MLNVDFAILIFVRRTHLHLPCHCHLVEYVLRISNCKYSKPPTHTQPVSASNKSNVTACNESCFDEN